jgi:predicted O-methyltransferase YrrM
MTGTTWAAVDDWIGKTLDLGGLDWVIAANTAAGLPGIDVSATQGRFLALLVRITGAARVLEIGTLGGYSTLWMAGALPEGGRIVTLEAEPLHARVARENIAQAGFAGRVEVIEGRAVDSLARLEGPFDLIFVDADKPSNPDYLRAALRLSRKGTVILLDNVVRGGGVVDGDSRDPSIIGTRAAFDLIAREPRLTAAAIQTVGTKGWDGFAIMTVD